MKIMCEQNESIKQKTIRIKHILDPKSVTELKNSLEGFNGVLDQAKENWQ